MLNSHTEHRVTSERSTKRLKHTGNLFRKNLQSEYVNSGMKVTKIIGQRKAFYRQNSSCARKETVDIDILVTSRKGDRKIMQYIRIPDRLPLRIGEWNQFNKFWRIFTKVIPIKTTSAGFISTMSRCLKRSSKWRSCILVSVAYPTTPCRSTNPDITTVFHTWLYGRFMEIQSNLRKRNVIERIKAPIFLEALLVIEIMEAPIQFKRESQSQHHKIWFFIRKDPTIFTSITPLFLDWSNKTSI